MTIKHLAALAALLLTFTLSAQQFDPEGAQVISYFPHLADGGPAAQRWITNLTFVNSHTSSTAIAVVSLCDNNGGPLALDFGTGAKASFTFVVPPQGTVTFQTAGVSPITVTGWAIVSSTLPLQGVVRFRFAANGVPQQGVSAQATAASGLFRSPATQDTGIAIANIYNNASLPVLVSAIDANGNTVAKSSLTLVPLGHTSYTLGQLVNLPPNFHGSVVIVTNNLTTPYFVAWTLSSDLGVLASYPPSGLGWPISQYERIWKVWRKVLDVASASFQLGTPPTLVIDYSTGQINSFANPVANEVHIFMNLAELISDSESELSFVVDMKSAT